MAAWSWIESLKENQEKHCKQIGTTCSNYQIKDTCDIVGGVTKQNEKKDQRQSWTVGNPLHLPCRILRTSVKRKIAGEAWEKAVGSLTTLLWKEVNGKKSHTHKQVEKAMKTKLIMMEENKQRCAQVIEHKMDGEIERKWQRLKKTARFRQKMKDKTVIETWSCSNVWFLQLYIRWERSIMKSTFL